MNQKLSDWASIAEIVSGIAIIVTLVFLTLGLRDNTNTTRTLVYQQLLGALNEMNIAVMQDQELSTLWIDDRGKGVGELSDQERTRLIVLYRLAFRNFDAAYYASQYGTLGASERERFENSTCVTYEGMDESIREMVVEVASREFQNFMASSCE